MATTEHRVKRGDTPTLKWDLERDLTGVTEAKVIVAERVGDPPAISRAGSMDNPTPADGIVSLALTADDYGEGKLEIGTGYLVEIETLPGPLTHPDFGYVTLTVVADLG